MYIFWILTQSGVITMFAIIYISQAKSIDHQIHLNVLPKKCGRRFEDSVSVGARIVGGTESRQGRHPWMALVFAERDNKLPAIPNCGGSILNKNHILTAGHCCSRANFPPVYVRVGEMNLQKTDECRSSENCTSFTQDLEVNTTILHPDITISYEMGWVHNDICLLRLNADILFNKFVEPICLPDLDTAGLRIGTILELAGWGLTESGQFPEALKETTLTIISAAECDAQLPPVLKHNISSEFCVQGENMKPCLGDSGGPLVHRGETGVFHVWGVASYSTEGISDPECRDGKPAVFADVTKYRQWIEDNIMP